MGREIRIGRPMPTTRITIQRRRWRIGGISIAGSRLAALSEEAFFGGLPSKGVHLK